MTSAVAVEIRDVLLRERGRCILDVPCLAIGAGEFLGVIGRNGAGKTTLLNVLAGLVRPTAGTVAHDGQDLTTVSRWRRTAFRRHVAYVPQATEYNADLPLTVREVVAMGCVGVAGLLRSLGAQAENRIDHWLERFGLEAMAGQTFRTLSGGEQQKALLARAMVQEPKILLLDEPAASLDLDWRDRMVGLLDGVYRQRSLTVVMVSHETSLLPACCTRVAMMEEGRILQCGVPEEVLTAEALGRLYGCPVRVWEAGGRRYTSVDLARGGRLALSGESRK